MCENLKVFTGAMHAEPLLADSRQQSGGIAYSIDSCHIEHCNALVRQKQVQDPSMSAIITARAWLIIRS